MSVSELVDYFDLEQPTISHHLRLLREAEFVDYRKGGLTVYYFVRHAMLRKARAILDGLYRATEDEEL